MGRKILIWEAPRVAMFQHGVHMSQTGFRTVAHQWPRHNLAVQLAKVEFVPIGRKAEESAAGRSQRPIPPPHERWFLSASHSCPE